MRLACSSFFWKSEAQHSYKHGSYTKKCIRVREMYVIGI